MDELKLYTPSGRSKPMGISMQSNLERFWSIVGENGSLLTSDEKYYMIEILCFILQTSCNIADIFTDEYEECNFRICAYNNCNPPMNWDYDIFSNTFNFSLTKQECWEAISKISTAEYNNGVFKNN